MVTLYRAGLENLNELADLFNKYRVFYKQESDLKAAKIFIKERLTNNESIIFIAELEGKAVGFTQLYTSFSSVSMLPIYILNDLYVEAEFRKNGIGETLLNTAKDLCRQNRFKGLALETAIDNPAQKLYEKLGWEKDSGCFHYFWSVR